MPNKRAAGMVVTSLALPVELLEAVRARAARDGVRASDVIRAAVKRYVKG